ncbi:MAG TPA: hypothetical protein VJN91_04415 [Gammaproteobacteria bacterium]|nr:hypothetical protein [Gammaproteobacteria bacterium]
MPERLLLVFPLLFAPAVAGQDQAEAPSAEFLEFLGEWQIGEGEWIGPDELEESEYARLDRLRQTEQEDEERPD